MRYFRQDLIFYIKCAIISIEEEGFTTLNSDL
jgi:hypothetical protein